MEKNKSQRLNEILLATRSIRNMSDEDKQRYLLNPFCEDLGDPVEVVTEYGAYAMSSSERYIQVDRPAGAEEELVITMPAVDDDYVRGRVYFITVAHTEGAAGAVYMSADGSESDFPLTNGVNGFINANGITWSPLDSMPIELAAVLMDLVERVEALEGGS